MPGFDGRGPRGMGPMTGGGRGFCSPWGLGRGWFGWGRGRGGSWGRGFGMGRSPMYQPPYPYTYDPPIYPSTPAMGREEELDSLQNQAQAIKAQLEQIEARMRELASKEV